MLTGIRSCLNTVRHVSSIQGQSLSVSRIYTTAPSLGSLHWSCRQGTSKTLSLINTRYGNIPAPVTVRRTTRRPVRTTTGWSPQLGSEPGLDSSTYAEANEGLESQLDDKEEISITIVDYSSKDLARHEVNPSIFDSFLGDNPKPDWATCRWIYINGIDQKILRSLGSNFDLHRLALEDVLESRGPVKADWYEGHLFVALPIHKLLASTTLEQELEEQKDKLGRHRGGRYRRDWRTMAYQKFNISVEQASIFWTNTDIVITIFQRSGNDVLKPVMNRLDSTNSILRSADDPSMLIQAVVDVAVDLCMPIEKAFADEFAEMELIVLSNPAIQQSRSLYILRSRLTLLLDNFIAINSLLQKLCGDHPLSSNPIAKAKASNHLERNPPFEASTSPNPVSRSVTISPTTQLYLRDVLDHVHTLSASTDVAIRSTENLTSLIFNTIAASQNESVRSLTVISSFFLPLTFLTGYMGMNFDKMPIVQQHSDSMFWVIAVPAMITMGIFMRVRARKKLVGPGSWMGWVRRSKMKSD